MSPSARPLDAAAAAVVVMLCMSWGLNQVAVKLVLPEIPPLMQATIRSLGALAIVVIWSWLRGVPLTRRDRTLVPGIIAGVLFGLEFGLIYRGLLWTTASRAVVFLYTAPFFVALGARWLGERLAPLQWAGLGLSFVGIAVAIGVPQSAVDARMLIGDAMLMAAAAGWAATTLIVKGTRLALASPEKTLAYQLIISVPMGAVGAWLLGERITAAPGPVALAWLAYQTIWVVGVTFGIWFSLVQRYSASQLTAFTFLTPLFGVAAGTLLLGDPITPTFAVAVLLVVAGLVLVNRPR